MPDRTKAPKITDALDMHLALKACTRYQLRNGVGVYAINAGEEEVVQLELVFAAGNSWENQNIVAAAANHLLKNGTTTLTAFELNEHFEFHGSYLNRHCYNETASISLHTLRKHLPELLPVMADMITNSVFPEEELAIFKQNSKQRLSVNLQRCDFVANRLIDAQIYGPQHPYGKYATMEDYDALQRETLVDFYNHYYVYGKCIIFVAGKLPADIFEQLDRNFGGLTLSAYEPEKIVRPFNPQEIITDRTSRIINDEKGVQGAIRMGRHFPNRHHPDFQKVGVLNNLFGGFFGSRLMDNIREDKGYTYGIHSYLQSHVEQSAWVVSTEAGRDVCEATLKEVYYEMEQLRNEPVEEDELKLVKNYMLGSILGDLDGPFQIIGRWKNYILNGTNDEYFYSAVENIKKITAAEIQELANKYLQPEAFWEMVVV